MITLHALTLLAALSAPGQSVLLDFYADWCGPCRAMEPTVRRLVADGYPVRMVNIDQDSSLARQYRVDGVPTYVLVADGREVSRAVGPTSYAHLAGMFSAAKPAAAAAPPVASPPTAVRQGSAPPSRAEEADPQTRALRATVRLCIEDAGGRSFGTGTIIDTHQQEALVMTCGHLFRESQGQGKMSVDVFPAGVQNPVAGEVLTLLSYDLEQDVALLAIRLNCPATPVPVAAAGYQVRPGDRVFSVGCDQGAPPTVRPSQVTALNKYQGPPNIESAGQPVIGRSGGGLFSADGQLIGVCNLADPQDDEGIYAALSLLHSHLDKIGQSRIYQRNAASSAVAQVPAAMAPTAPATLAVSPPDMASQMPHPPLGAPDPSVAAAAAAPLIATAAAALDDDTEVICIVRSKRDPRGPSQVLYFDRLSPALLEQLTRAARPAQTGGPVMLEASRDSLPPSRATSEASSPVVRAQAY